MPPLSTTMPMGRGVMLVSGVLLLISDLRYHFSRSPQRIGIASTTILLVIIPWLRFRRLHPEALFEHLRSLNSYWIQSIPLTEKLQRFGSLYLQGLDPRYRFWPNTVDLDRYRFPNAGHLPLFLLPFIAIGLIVYLWRWRGIRGTEHLLLPCLQHRLVVRWLGRPSPVCWRWLFR
ncbi:MAG: hypothetical protein ACUVSL_06945 [Chloroflexus sp.]|uniref:hypothetical protein n=1 Tax=Chloroflexus sp. TaxID=1904827 RepID=UPI00404B1AAA